MKPFLIGIAGPSCSGKTTLAAKIAAGLRGGAVVIALDMYYRDFSGVPADAINVDVPEALDSDLILSQVRQLVNGESVEQPAYDYATHSRRPHGVSVSPRETIIVEGLFALYWEGLVDMMDARLFVDLDHDRCLERRVRRDVRERGRTAESVAAAYERKVRPMYDRHVLPTRARADLVLSGEKSRKALVAEAVQAIAKIREKARPR